MRSISLTLMFPYLLMSIALFYVAAKTKPQGKNRCFWMVNALILLAGAVLCAVNAVVLSERLVAPSLFAPIGLFLALLGFHTVWDYHRCRQKVEATCVGSQSTSHRGVTSVTPKFRYRYQDRLLESPGLNTYSKAAFDRLLDEAEPLTVHIDPDRPLVCVHKPSYRWGNTVFLIVLGMIFLLVAAAFLFLG